MFEVFRKHFSIIAAVSEKKDGTMKLSGDPAGDKEIIKNRNFFLEKLGIDEELTIKANLIHKNNVVVVSGGEAGKTIKETDGLITAEKKLFLTITVADCLPIFIYDPEKKIVGLIHGGWKNLAGDILDSAVKKMTETFNSLPEDILVGVGPGISQCHFEVNEDLLAEFRHLGSDFLLEKNGKLFLDLKKIAKIQLIGLGVKEKNIEISPECTFCLKDKYFSFRRDLPSHQFPGGEDKPKEIKTMLAVIGRK